MTSKHLMQRRPLASGLAVSLLWQWAVVVVLLVACVWWQWPLAEQIYLTGHTSIVGIIVNGLIAAVWAVSMLGVMLRLLGYHIEERALHSFAQQIMVSKEAVLKSPDPDSLVGQRYATLQSLREHDTVADQGALAAALVASEAARNGFLRFVYNVLILVGVLGTIAALSIALLGVSDLFDFSSQAKGLDSVLSGMSTALSTTMTAIIAYLLFGYFYIRLQDVQSSFLAQLEQLTATVLIPKLGLDEKAEARDYAATSAALRKLIECTLSTQSDYAAVAEKLQATFNELGRQAAQANERYAELLTRMADMGDRQQAHQKEQAAQTAALARLLREGFRLNSD